MSNNSETDGMKVAFFAMGLGAFGFWNGFKMLKLRRKMGDIPTSKIASAAVGSFVEIQGKVVCAPGDFITAPLTGIKGVCFVWHIEEQRGSGKNKKWVTINFFYSCPFLYIKDKSEHLAAIDLEHCDFQEEMQDMLVHFNNQSFDLPVKAKKILHEYKMFNMEDKAGFFSSSNYRISEKVFKANDRLYVLGGTINPPESESSRLSTGENIFGTRNKPVAEEVHAILEKAKSNPEIVKMYDKDANSKLDPAELNQLHKDIQNKIFTDYNLSHQSSYLQKCKLLFTMVEDHDLVFSMKKVFVSHKSEKDLSQTLLSKASLGLIGGPLLFIGGLFFLIESFKK
jgi:hypothetical protein